MLILLIKNDVFYLIWNFYVIKLSGTCDAVLPSPSACIITFISIYTLENVSNSFIMQKIKSKLKRFKSQQTNKEWKKQQSFILTAHILILHSFDVYIYTNFIYAIYSKIDIKHLMNRNENIKFREKIMSKWLWHSTLKIRAFNI